MSAQKFTTKKLTTMAMLTAIALAIYVAELQIPILIPIAGVKLGLANVVTLFAIFTLNKKETFCILIMRIVLGSIFAGRMVGFLYSISGGILCFAAMALLRKHLDDKSVWIAGVVGAVCHNIGQLVMAAAITKTAAVFVYFPILLAAAIAAGMFTGFTAQFLLQRYRKM